jgi:cytochrome c peroxidase
MTLRILATACSVSFLITLSAAAADPPATKAPNGAPAKNAKSQKVLLGTPELTSGIPGDGPLTVEEIKAWLAKPENHQPLDVELPQGLAVGAGGIHIPKDNPLTRAKIELGRQVYFENRISGDGTLSCASCHAPTEGYSRRTTFGVGIRGQTGNRNSPVAYNRILSTVQFWDGRADSLEEQAKGPIANPIEMGSDHESCVACHREIDGNKFQIDNIIPGDGVTNDTVAKAIASFERAIVTGTSPADKLESLVTFEKAFKDYIDDPKGFQEDDAESYQKYLKLKKAVAEAKVSDSARRGRELFFGKANCTACHVGANFTDEKFHNIGVGMDAKEPDLGRYVITKEEKDKGAFKTPTVRNVALTAPYMHDGSQKTLEEVVEWYDKGGHPNPYLSEKIKKLNLTAQEKKDLVEYMKSLTGELPQVRTDRLPK